MMTKLFYYFEPAGIASILLWMLAMSGLAVSFCRRFRSLLLWTSLMLAVAGLVTALVNQNRINAVQIDWAREQELERQRKQAEVREAINTLRGRASSIRFAEDSSVDQLDLAGIKTPENEYEQALLEAGDPLHAYRVAGKKKRSSSGGGAGAGAGQDEVRRTSTGKWADVVGDGEGESGARVMLVSELNEAQHYNRVNKALAYIAFWLSLILVVIDYLRRYNEPASPLYPVPLYAPLADAFSMKRNVLLINPGSPQGLWWFVEKAFMKGENTIIFANDGFWSAFERTVPRGRSLPEQRITATDPLVDYEAVFESVWFRRTCLAVEAADADGGEIAVRKLQHFLEIRRMARAGASWTVNIVWGFQKLPSRELCESLFVLCREANFRFVSQMPEHCEWPVASLADEVVEPDISAPGWIQRWIDGAMTGIVRSLSFAAGLGGKLAGRSRYYCLTLTSALASEEVPERARVTASVQTEAKTQE